MGFSSESVAAFIAVLGILSIIAQVSHFWVFHWATWEELGTMESFHVVDPEISLTFSIAILLSF